MIDLTHIATEHDLGQVLNHCGIDNDPLHIAPELVSNFWRSDSRYRSIARFLRGNPNSATLLTAHMGNLELHEQDPQNFWFHTLPDKLAGTVRETHIASWICDYLFPSVIVPERIAAVRAHYPQLDTSTAWLSILLRWSIIDTDPLSRAPEAIQQCWKRMWEAERAPEACYLRGIVGIASVVANPDNQLILYQFDPQHEKLEYRARLQIDSDRTTVEVHQWIYAHWQRAMPI